MLLSLSVPSFASNGAGEFIGEGVIVYERETIDLNDPQAPELPSEGSIIIFPSRTKFQNYVLMDVIDGGNDTIKIWCANIAQFGLDSVDYASCLVAVYDDLGRMQYKRTHVFQDIWPLFPQTDSLYVPNWSRVEVTSLYARDGGVVEYGENFTYYR